MLVRCSPLFPAALIAEFEEKRSGPAADVERRGITWPVAVVFATLEGYPTAFVELGFMPKGESPEPMSPKNWVGVRKGLRLPSLGDQGGQPFHGGHEIEFGPFTLLRGPHGLRFFLPTPAAEWMEAAKKIGSCLVALGPGLEVLENGMAIPEGAVLLVAKCRGSFLAPTLEAIPGLHALPLTRDHFDPLVPNSFLLDTDVLIGIERFCLAPQQNPGRTDTIRQVLLNLSYRDVLPGMALTQIYEQGRRTTNRAAALRAAKAAHEVMAWDREQVAKHSVPCESFREGFLEDFRGVAATPTMLALYAGVLRLRRLWHPGASLTARELAFGTYVAWLRTELRLAAPALFQIAANLLISGEAAHRQAAQLLHYRNAPATKATLDELWGTAFDLFILTAYANAVLEEDILEPVLLTFDAGMAAMFNFFRHVGVGPILADVGEDGPQAFLVATRVEFHPQLSHLREDVNHWLLGLQADAQERARRGELLDLRAEEFSRLADTEEWLLLVGK